MTWAIGSGDVPGQQDHLADRQPLAELQQLRRRDHVLARLALAQEIDVEIGGDRERRPGRSPTAAPHTCAKSASAIRVGPETVPPGRSIRSL